jgi:ABC-type sugar transport system ATPase subunit
MSDRIMVMAGGRVRGFLDREEATQEKIMELATVTDRPAEGVTEA